MYRSSENILKYQPPESNVIECVSRGDKHSIVLGQLAMHVNSANGDMAFKLSMPETLFSSVLLENPNCDYLASEIKDLKPSLAEYSISSTYRDLSKTFGPHQIRDNFIAFGTGRATRYAYLLDSTDPREMIKKGKFRVFESGYSERRINKQIRAYDELADFYNGLENRDYSKRKKKLGATALATTIVVGGTTYYIHKKIHQK
jgi:hypothetical protein